MHLLPVTSRSSSQNNGIYFDHSFASFALSWGRWLVLYLHRLWTIHTQFLSLQRRLPQSFWTVRHRTCTRRIPSPPAECHVANLITATPRETSVKPPWTARITRLVVLRFCPTDNHFFSFPFSPCRLSDVVGRQIPEIQLCIPAACFKCRCLVSHVPFPYPLRKTFHLPFCRVSAADKTFSSAVTLFMSRPSWTVII